MTVYSGGPAFPSKSKRHALYINGVGQGDPITIQNEGMSLRDYFAAQAMQGLIESLHMYDDPDSKGMVNIIAEKAYEYADVMLAARDKENV